MSARRLVPFLLTLRCCKTPPAAEWVLAEGGPSSRFRIPNEGLPAPLEIPFGAKHDERPLPELRMKPLRRVEPHVRDAE